MNIKKISIVFLCAATALLTAGNTKMETVYLHENDNVAKLEIFSPPKNNGVAVLVCPGGGYAKLCATYEGRGIAKWLNKHGYTAAVLYYHVKPDTYARPLQDAKRAMRYLRFNSGKYGIAFDQIGVMGFSAGGHLATTLATHFDYGDLQASDPLEKISCRPDFQIAIYPVITMGDRTHRGSLRNLLGKNPDPEKIKEFSNELQVSADTPPAFVCHSTQDTVVPVSNSRMYVEALKKNHIPCSYFELTSGNHGLGCGKGSEWQMWQEKCLQWLKSNILNDPRKEKTVVLTLDDAVKNHLYFVAPLLKKYNFNATFFICKFKGDEFMDASEVKALQDMGFEIGHHTFNHTRKTDPENNYLNRLDDFLQSAGVRYPLKSFAYPSGPFVPAFQPELKKRGYIFGRTTEKRAWDIAGDNLMRIPCIPLQKDNREEFLQALSLCGNGKAVVLLFHGVPDTAHPWVTTSQEAFAEFMQYLKENNYRVVSMQDMAGEVNRYDLP